MDDREIPAINRRIKEIRMALGISQKRFSGMVALSSGYLSRVETAEKAVNDRLVKLICSTFSVNENYLRYGTGEIFNEVPDERFMNLVHNFKSLPPKYQEFLFKMFDMFLQMKNE
jgi:transcriptional regulator with XRE-family HTH domain